LKNVLEWGDAVEDGRKALWLSLQVVLRFVRDALPGVNKRALGAEPPAFRYVKERCPDA
jgi:hypothetical protein